jgi:hypothetical protein
MHAEGCLRFSSGAAFFHRQNDSFLIFFPEIGMHRKAENSPCTIFTDGKIPFGVPEKLEGLLEVKRAGIVNGCGDTVTGQNSLNGR